MAPKLVTKTSKRVVAEGRVQKAFKGKDAENSQAEKKVKKWLETPQDWARFNEWAKINAQPRSIPVETPIVRIAKPLRTLLKRVRYLSRPTKPYDPNVHCRTDYLSVSRAALFARPSKRVLELAVPAVRREPSCRVFPLKISRAALHYVPSAKIMEISRPHVYLSESCKRWIEKQRKVSKRKITEQEKLMRLSKKMFQCPDIMTDEERRALMTPTGVRRTALIYESTPWMLLLSLPAYKFLKDRNDKDAKKWKRILIEEGPLRGKKVLAEYQIKKGQPKSAGERKGRGRARNSKIKNNRGVSKDNDRMAKYEINEEERKRYQERNAWRYAPTVCKSDPYAIKRAALKATASARVNQLAAPSTRESKICREDPFGVKKSALTATSSSRIDQISRPARPRSPIERPPPREKDKYGMPIFVKPVD